MTKLLNANHQYHSRLLPHAGAALLLVPGPVGLVDELPAVRALPEALRRAPLSPLLPPAHTLLVVQLLQHPIDRVRLLLVVQPLLRPHLLVRLLLVVLLGLLHDRLVPLVPALLLLLPLGDAVLLFLLLREQFGGDLLLQGRVARAPHFPVLGEVLLQPKATAAGVAEMGLVARHCERQAAHFLHVLLVLFLRQEAALARVAARQILLLLLLLLLLQSGRGLTCSAHSRGSPGRTDSGSGGATQLLRRRKSPKGGCDSGPHAVLRVDFVPKPELLLLVLLLDYDHRWLLLDVWSGLQLLSIELLLHLDLDVLFLLLLLP